MCDFDWEDFMWGYLVGSDEEQAESDDLELDSPFHFHTPGESEE